MLAMVENESFITRIPSSRAHVLQMVRIKGSRMRGLMGYQREAAWKDIKQYVRENGKRS
jgi:hypothetical protein